MRDLSVTLQGWVYKQPKVTSSIAIATSGYWHSGAFLMVRLLVSYLSEREHGRGSSLSTHLLIDTDAVH